MAKIATVPEKKVKKAVKKAKIGSHQLAAELPAGTILKDASKNEWKLGKWFATGGFGLLYEVTNVKNSKDIFVMKLEPAGNGPLFCEMVFYKRWCTSDKLKDCAISKGSTKSGIPPHISSGMLNHVKGEYRFLVMEKYGKDVHKLWMESGQSYSEKTTFTLAVKVLDSLEYIHDKEYVHADIKGSNLLLGFSNSDKHNVYLADFGLVAKYTLGKEHVAYKPDKRKAHVGTAAYTSRDAHDGCKASRRGDLEILGYCMLEWINGSLPWSKDIENHELVAKKKNKLFDDLKGSFSECNSFSDTDTLLKYFEYVDTLEYDEKPDYALVKKLLQFRGYTGKLDFSANDSAGNSNCINNNGTGQNSKNKVHKCPFPAKPIKRRASPIKRKNLTVPSKGRKRPSVSPIRKKTIPLKKGRKIIEEIDKSEVKITISNGDSSIQSTVSITEIDSDTSKDLSNGDSSIQSTVSITEIDRNTMCEVFTQTTPGLRKRRKINYKE